MNKDILSKVFIGLGVSAIVIGIVYYFKKGIDNLIEIGMDFSNIRIQSVSLNEVVGSTDLKLSNPSDLGFTITDYNIDIIVNGVNMLTLTAKDISVKIPSRGVVIVPLEIRFDPKKLGLNTALLFVQMYSQQSLNSQGLANSKIQYLGTLSGKFAGLSIKNIDVDYTQTF